MPRTELRARARHARPEQGADAGRAVPECASGLELLGEVSGSGYKQTPSLVRRADGQTLQLTPLLYEVVAAIDGQRNCEEIAAVVGGRVSREVTSDDIYFLIDEKLRPLGVLRRADGAEPVVKKLNPLLGLRLRKVVTDRKVTRRIIAPFVWLFHPLVALPVLVGFGAVVAWVLFEQGLAGAARQALYEPGMLLLVFGLTMISAAFHEIGHAAAVRYGGATPGAMGVGLYLVWPAFYTDVTDSYRLGRGGRLRVDLGGLYFNAIFAVLTLGLWAATRWEALLLLVPAQLLHMAQQMLPFVRFDGYHILADLTGVPDLFAHIKPTLRHMLPWRWFRREPNVLKPWARFVVTLWVLAVVPVLAFMFLTMVRVLPRVAATAWDSIGNQWEALQVHWSKGAAAEVAVAILAILTIALPVASMTYLLVRLARRLVQKVWSGTAGRPVLRGLAAIAALVAMALLAWSWWPSGQYRPIEANEQGTVFDLLAQAPATAETAPAPSSSALSTEFLAMAQRESLRPQLVMVVSPEGVPVTKAGPKEIIPLGDDGEWIDDGTTISPEPGTTPGDQAGGEWSFPWNPPAGPSEGDNQALAVNTEDGSTVYDVALAVLWVTDGDVDEINEAWAMADCTDCKTVAVAFQSIFIVGDSDVVIPQNRAVAANYDCTRCETHAVAVQLITTLTEMPSDEAMAELARVWEDLKEFEDNIEDIPLEELHKELSLVEAKILTILAEDGVLALPEQEADADTTDPAPAESGEEADQTPEPSETSNAVETQEDTAEDPAAGEEPTEEPTEEPSETPAEEPAAQPSEEPAVEPSPTP